MLYLYKTISKLSKPALLALLSRRLAKGKEDPSRIAERKGKSEIARPEGKLFWVHAASVGEAQSALVLIHGVLRQYPDAQCLVTTGTKTSAALMRNKLPDRAIHQYYPLDHPKWAARFLDHWRPDICLWMESELWPNMLLAIQKRKIPAALVNARLSPRSYRRWKRFQSSIATLLDSFGLILAQRQAEADYFIDLGAKNVLVSDNLKYSAKPLDCDEQDYNALLKALSGRPVVTYASTHKGEEDLACQIHSTLKDRFPGLLSIIVPRHPDRGHEVSRICDEYHLDPVLRRLAKRVPDKDTDIYIVDTIGELGLIYKMAPFAFIGRTFSDDGGGGHNPLEAALLNCAVLHGPHYQNLSDIFEDMNSQNAAIQIHQKKDLGPTIEGLLHDPERLAALQKNALDFAARKSRVIDTVMDEIKPLLNDALR
tara:strand:+ start:865 stop:2142 length:1278 start_codon:yes stop_codon:yes gene_type:complete